MFLLEILSGLILGQLLSAVLIPLIYYFLPRTILYSIKGEMKLHSFFLWFISPTFNMIIIYAFAIVLLFFPSVYNSSFFVNYFFGISFVLVFIINIIFTIRKSHKKNLNQMFENFAIKNNFYKDYYNQIQTYCESGNYKKDISNDFDGAIEDYTRGIEINANYSSLYFNRATAYLNKFDFQNALNDFDKAIELESNISEYYDGRATAKREIGDIDGAIADYKKSNQLSPDKTSTLINLYQLLKD